MISSNINEQLLKIELEQSIKENKSHDFLNAVSKTNEDNQSINSSKTDSFTYKNIKGISLEEIDTIFKDEESKQMAKNLRLATLFTSDNILGEAMFNTVLGQPFELGYSYLSDRYNDKHSFFLSSSSNNLADLLHETISRKINTDDKNSTDVISQDKLDEILLQVNSFNFLDTLSNTSRNQYDYYKDKNEDYSFLYNDYNLKYQELLYKYDELNKINNNIINQL